MIDKFKNKYRIPSARLQGYDYGSNGFYFVTICTKNREHYFGNIETGNCPSEMKSSNYPSDLELCNNPTTVETGTCPSLHATITGQCAINFWMDISQHYPFVALDKFVVMPNHIHGILFFNRPEKRDWQPNQFGVQSQNLGAVIRGFKSSVKRVANQSQIDFEWQSRYHDRIIRNERELNAIRQYIIDNPLKWGMDALNASVVETGNCPSLHAAIEDETEILLNKDLNNR